MCGYGYVEEDRRRVENDRKSVAIGISRWVRGYGRSVICLAVRKRFKLKFRGKITRKIDRCCMVIITIQWTRSSMDINETVSI